MQARRTLLRASPSLLSAASKVFLEGGNAAYVNRTVRAVCRVVVALQYGDAVFQIGDSGFQCGDAPFVGCGRGCGAAAVRQRVRMSFSWFCPEAVGGFGFVVPLLPFGLKASGRQENRFCMRACGLLFCIENEVGRPGRAFSDGIVPRMKNGNLYMQIKLLRPSENLFSGFQTALCF